MKKKILVCAIVFLFVGMSVIPITGSRSSGHVVPDEEIQNLNMCDDTTPPYLSVDWTVFKDHRTEKWLVLFIVYAYDEESRISYVMMEVTGILWDYIDEENDPPYYYFTYDWGFSQMDMLWFDFLAYDNAGNIAHQRVYGSDIKSYTISQQSGSPSAIPGQSIPANSQALQTI
jgi:hypothetical protein